MYDSVNSRILSTPVRSFGIHANDLPTHISGRSFAMNFMSWLSSRGRSQRHKSITNPGASAETAPRSANNEAMLCASSFEMSVSHLRYWSTTSVSNSRNLRRSTHPTSPRRRRAVWINQSSASADGAELPALASACAPTASGIESGNCTSPSRSCRTLFAPGTSDGSSPPSGPGGATRTGSNDDDEDAP